MAKTMIAAGYFCKKKELENYAKNIFQTEKILQKFEFQQELKRSGLWLDIAETKRRASHTLKMLLDNKLIQNGLIVPGMLEYISEVAAC